MCPPDENMRTAILGFCTDMHEASPYSRTVCCTTILGFCTDMHEASSYSRNVCCTVFVFLYGPDR